MKLLKIGLVIGLIFVGGALSVQAKSVSESVHTYEQTANEAYTSFYNSASEQTSQIQQASKDVSETYLRDIEAELPSAYDMNPEQIGKRIATYKDDYVTTIQAEKEQLTDDMYTEYEQVKKERLQEEITDDITDFLEEITK